MNLPPLRTFYYCSACPIGHSCNARYGTAASQCSQGRYQPLTGQSVCLECGVGTYGPTRGATSLASCAPCPPVRVTRHIHAVLSSCRYTFAETFCSTVPTTLILFRRVPSTRRRAAFRPRFASPALQAVILIQVLSPSVWHVRAVNSNPCWANTTVLSVRMEPSPV